MDYPLVIYEERKWSVYVHENMINGKKYVIALMVRVKPDKIRCPNGDDNLNDIWVLNSSNDEVRPYRILFKEIKNMK